MVTRCGSCYFIPTLVPQKVARIGARVTLIGKRIQVSIFIFKFTVGL